MRRLILLMAITMTIGMNTFAQSGYETSKDTENGSIVFKGALSFNDLENEPTFDWFKTFGTYKPEAAAITYLTQNLKDYKIVAAMGTWCEDSHNLIPKLYQVLKLSGYRLDSVKLIGVDRSKDALKGEKAEYNIVYVPAIILYKDGKEAGRIVESVQQSIEQDLAKIISGN